MLVTGGQSDYSEDTTVHSCNTARLLSSYLNDKENGTCETDSWHFSNGDLIMIIFEATTRKIVSVNDAACKFYGYSKEEFLSKCINDINTSTYEEIGDRIEKTRNNIEKRFTTQHRVASGKVKDIEVFSNPFTLNDQELIHNIVFDITKRIQYEKELMESKERYKRLVQLSPYAIMVHTGDRFIFVNKAGANLFEVSNRKQLIGVSIKDFIHEDFKDVIIKKIDKIKKSKEKVLEKEIKIVTTTGKVVDVSMNLSLIQYDGEEVIMTILTDITERKEKERLLKKAEEDKEKMNEMMEYDKLRTEFFANISHELRTPINVILGSLQLVDKYEDEFILNPHKLKKLVGTMKQNCFRLLRLINNLIDITKIDSGFFTLTLQNVDIVKVIEDIVLSVANYYTGNIGVEIIFDTDIEEKIMGFDPDKLERIMLNLLSNALKFTDKGDKIEVYVYDKKDKLMISVKDTGTGIPEEKLDIIFDRFRQADKSLTRNHEGSGIGLSLVKSFVEMHGGSVSVKSEYGKGSEFIIEMPAKLVSDSNNRKDFGMMSQDNKNIKRHVERINIEFSDIYT
ncbi:PAS domain-containing sensor histidine kinase [Alkaliphilus sp. B6464]|uniref:PAS domain-containing sensor histidine kinase n=1 Tax=Alkaliphilus sp. B6464 TaxID=2731219 RepID=UPI001BA8294C|nr:PAS domain-containing sensor histidine kinase [Alkaliphilus sp. B6464]QUH20139.1 PAS domain-containing sensor histidine kinase [Alkaliphilus sp. B6464]